MSNRSRRAFLATATVAALAAADKQRVFVATNTPDGILAFDWEAATGDLTPVGVANKINNVDWVTYSPARDFLFAAAEVDTFNGKPSGEVASFRVRNGELTQLSAQNSAAGGTCHV